VFLCCSLSALTGFLDFLLLSAGACALLVLWECSALFSGWDESHWVHMVCSLRSGLAAFCCWVVCWSLQLGVHPVCVSFYSTYRMLPVQQPVPAVHT
jgi:hypothetical protein